MILTLEPRLVESLQRALNNLPPGTIQELDLNLVPAAYNDDCQNHPSDEALETTATQLADIVSRVGRQLLRRIRLCHEPFSMTSSFLATCSQLEYIEIGNCPLVLLTANVEAMLSIKTIQQLEIRACNFPDSESVNAFCRGIETISSLESLLLHDVSFSPDHQEQVAATLAGCDTLLHFNCETGRRNPSFFDHYCLSLSNNVNTKLERLRLLHGTDRMLFLQGHHSTVRGLEVATFEKDSGCIDAQ